MKCILLGGLGVAFLMGVVGCGGAGIDAGAPTDLTPGVKIDPNLTSPGGKFGVKAAQAASNKSQQAQSAPGGGAPAEPK
jgi:hypothetical protein